MSAFVTSASALLSKSSSFTGTASGPTSITSLNRHRQAVAAKSCSRTLARMTMNEGEAPIRDSPSEFDETKLFVGNLAWGTTEESLKEAFTQYGEVVDARVITDRFTGRSRGFGFVEYDAASEASAALEAMNGAEIDGRNVRVDRAASRQRQFRPRNDDFGY